MLRNAHLLAEVAPQVGGGLARLDWLGGNAAPTPLLRPWPAQAPGTPLPSQLACFPMLPWANRMAPDGFVHGGVRYAPAPNRAGEPCPIHGDAWLQPWQCATHDAASVVLTLARRAAHPFSYEAQLRYTLDGAALVIELAVTNTGPVALPFGIGLHPWMPDPQGARLHAGANRVWLAEAGALPAERAVIPPHWRFDTPAALPRDGVDHVFDGWSGTARIDWPARGVALEIETDMDHFILYVPQGRDVFCFEPVDHPVNAHNLPGHPGLSILAPGATLRRRCVLRGHGA